MHFLNFEFFANLLPYCNELKIINADLSSTRGFLVTRRGVVGVSIIRSDRNNLSSEMGDLRDAPLPF